MRPRDRTIRFWEKVVRGPGCWEWAGWRNLNGYGVIATGPRGEQRKELAHRVSWEVNFGPIPEGMGVLHRCDNPPCVRPDHLFLGTPADNTADMVAKGRALTGTANPQAVLTPEAVRLIRASTGSQRAVAARLGVSASLVSRVRRRELWKDVA